MKHTFLFTFFILSFTFSTYAQDEYPTPIYSAEKKENGISRYYIFNSEGKLLLKNAVDWAYSNGWCWVLVVNRSTGLIRAFDSSGNEFAIDSIQETQSTYTILNLAGIKKNNKWGFYDRAGKLKIAHQFDEISHFHENMAAVKIDGNIYMIDTNGIKLNTKYPDNDEHYGFGDSDIALGMGGDFYHPDFKKIEKAKKSGLVNKKGELIIPVEYDRLFDMKDKSGRISAEKNGRYGVLKFGGAIVIPFEYESVFVLNDYF